MDTNSTVNPVTLAGDTESLATLGEIYDSCARRISENDEFPEGSAERKQFAVSVCVNNTTNLFTKVDISGWTAFHLALNGDSTEMLEALIEAARRLPPPITCSTNDATTLETLLRRPGRQDATALLTAVMLNKFEHAKLLAEADPNDRHVQRESSPLYIAARNDRQVQRESSPLYIAASLGYLNIVKMIAETCTAPAVDGALLAVIPQLPAGYTGSSDIVESIIEAGKRHYNSTAPTSHSFVAFIQQADYISQNTALHLAVLGNHLGVVKQILKANPSYICENIDNDESDTNSENKTPIYIAAEQGYKDIVQELCKHSTLSLTCTKGPRNQTILHAAVLGRDKGCVELVVDTFPMQFLDYSQDEDGWTPLHHAAHSKFDSVIGILGQRFREEASGLRYTNPTSDFYDIGGPSPLWLATEQGHITTTVEIINVLPKLCVEVDPESRQNMLHLAAEKNDKEMIQAIIETCPPEYLPEILNGRDINKNTPLHLLIAKGCFVRQLIEHEQIDKTARNYQNWTPFDMLYDQDDIVADQLAIKKFLDEANQSSRFWIWRRSSSKMMDTQKSLVPPKKKIRKRCPI